MNCYEASELLAAAVLGDLDRDTQRAVHTHLAGCDRCLEVEGELFESMRLLRAHGEVEPGAGFHDSVMARAAGAGSATDFDAASPLPHPRVGRLTQTLLTAAATALIVVSLQTALEYWNRSAAPSFASTAAGITARTSQWEKPAPSLLQGTLFDRQRNIPDDLRQLRQQLRRGDDLRPLNL